MKKLTLFVLISSITLCLNVQAQITQFINYQGVARNSNGVPFSEQTISIRFNVLDSSAAGPSVYGETHSTTTSTSGLFNVFIGNGAPVTGDYSSINWGSSNKWLKVEMDTTGGSNFQNIGTTQFLNVPYALYAATSGIAQSVVTTPSHYIGELFGGGIVFRLSKDSTGAEHGLIVSTQSLGSVVWSNAYDNSLANANYALSTWDGFTNCTEIVNQPGHTTSAAQLCFNYNGGGNNDWYLPSIGELMAIFQSKLEIERALDANFFISGDNYWTSTSSGTEPYSVLISAYGFSSSANYGSFKVLAIRAF